MENWKKSVEQEELQPKNGSPKVQNVITKKKTYLVRPIEHRK
jgi:hypothetical protein